MPEPALDHRRATAERNAVAILDATERLLQRRGALNMAAIASEAGVSRPTLYAHFRSLSEVVEAAVARAVEASGDAVAAAEPGTGPADEALQRLLAASWGAVARQDALARAAAEHLPSDHVHRTHAPLMTGARELVVRGQRDGVFRDDLPADWLVTLLFALIHASDDHARAHRVPRDEALQLLRTTVRDLFAPR
jgi:TetR/AcrR family transcriptional regulator, mexCD-oprJ operon repressor